MTPFDFDDNDPRLLLSRQFYRAHKTQIDNMLTRKSPPLSDPADDRAPGRDVPYLHPADRSTPLFALTYLLSVVLLAAFFAPMVGGIAGRYPDADDRQLIALGLIPLFLVVAYLVARPLYYVVVYVFNRFMK